MDKDFWDKSVEFLVPVAYVVGLLGALAILGWQVFYWLRTSIWIPVPLYEALAYLGIDITRVYMPTDWQGLAKVVQWLLDVPLTIAVPITFISLAHIWQAIVSTPNSHA
ncbi:MAG: hypothetical protein Q8L39_16210 [Burkholderiales bacterium]|nr:hypothetical protein [Burkholderiales bacterium]